MTTPKYRQITDAVRHRIATGTYPPGAPIPSEADIADEFGVTRPTVRQGLAELRADGTLLVVNGRGAFVRDPDILALRRERDVAWGMAQREADRAEHAEGALRSVLEYAAELEASGTGSAAARLREIIGGQ